MKNIAIPLLLMLSSISAQASAFEPAAKWYQSNVRVCWLNSETFKKNPQIADDSTLGEEDKIVSSQKLSQLVQSKIEEQFTRAKTGIHFSGWQACILDSANHVLNADAIIAFNRVTEFAGVIEGDSSIGLSIEEVMEKPTRRSRQSVSLPTVAIHLPMVSTYKNKNVSYADAVAMTALHEFGHLAGLVHEHMAFMDQALRDSQCVNGEFGRIFKQSVANTRASYSKDYLNFNFELKTAIKSFYDSHSIMNYCELYQRMSQGFTIHDFSLSAGDDAMLISIYSKKK